MNLHILIEVKNKPICLICNEAVSVLREFSSNRRYNIKCASTLTNCLFHQENLCAKTLKAGCVRLGVVKVVNLIFFEGLNHREFEDFVHNLKTEFKHVVYYSDV
jgi:hypothetical protein